MIINTGDLVEVGSNTTHWDNYMQQISVSDFDLFHVVGNHDTTGTPAPLEYYEQYVGPPYYSFEMGSYHFVVYNNEEPLLGTPNEDVWLDRDIAQRAAGSRILLFQHRMLRELPEPKAHYWGTLGIQAVFSGHWHATQLGRQPNGMVDYNICRTRSGGLDHTSRAFAIVTCEADGTIDYEMRRLAVNHHVGLSHPQPGSTIFGEVLEVMLETYDTSSNVSTAVVTVSGANSSVGPLPLVREGPSLWRLPVALTTIETGGCMVSVTGSFDDGAPFAKSATFTRSAATASTPPIGDDWPMFRREPKGTSFTSSPLEPPLSLAWVRAVPGFVELSSPVVSNGRVFLGTRAENRMTEAGVSAFDARTGTPLWFQNLPGGIALAPAVAGDIVIASTMGDSTYGLSAETGAIVWKKRKLGVRYDMTAPVVEGSTAWVSAEPRTYQMNTANGAVAWQSTNLGNDWFPYIYSAPAVSPTHTLLRTVRAPQSELRRLHHRRSNEWSDDVQDRRRLPLSGVGRFRGLRRGRRRPQLPEAQEVRCGGKSDLDGDESGRRRHGLTRAGEQCHGRFPARTEGSKRTMRRTARVFGRTRSARVMFEMANGVRGGKSTSATPAIAESTVYVGSCDGSSTPST